MTPPVPLKRDRENSTVFVADLPSDVSESDLIAFFKEVSAIFVICTTALRFDNSVATFER